MQKYQNDAFKLLASLYFYPIQPITNGTLNALQECGCESIKQSLNLPNMGKTS
jgi:hypothetical protein